MISFLKGMLIRHFHNTECVWKLENVTIKIAESFEELKAASDLLHDSYVGKKLMEAHPSGMRINIHSLLPHCTVIIAIDKFRKVIGTVSLIMDTQLGIPADHAFSAELKIIRGERHRRIVEVSALAIHPDYRQESHSVQFLLNRYLYIYCRDNLKINTLVIVIHPAAEHFYKALLLFKTMGKTVSYSFVKGALARLMYLDFSGDYEKRIWRKYLYRKKSLVDYILHHRDDRLIFKNHLNDSVCTSDKSISLMLIKSSKFAVNNMNDWELSSLITGLNLEKKDLEVLKVRNIKSLSSYRFHKNISACLTINEKKIDINIFNVCKSGAFLEINDKFLNEHFTEGRIVFNWKGNEFSSDFKVRWVNKGQSSKLPSGIGIEFVSCELELFNVA